MLPKVEEEEAAGVMAMAMTVNHRREEERAEGIRRGRSENFGSWVSQRGGGRLWSAREQGGRSEPLPSFKYPRARNGQIRNQRLFSNRPGIVRRKVRMER